MTTLKRGNRFIDRFRSLIKKKFLQRLTSSPLTEWIILQLAFRMSNLVSFIVLLYTSGSCSDSIVESVWKSYIGVRVSLLFVSGSFMALDSDSPVVFFRFGFPGKIFIFAIVL